MNDFFSNYQTLILVFLFLKNHLTKIAQTKFFKFVLLILNIFIDNEFDFMIGFLNYFLRFKFPFLFFVNYYHLSNHF